LKHALRLLLERATRQLVLRRRLPAEFGGAAITVSPGAALTYLRSLSHRNHAELYRLAADHVRAGDRVWDIGANVGIFAFSAAHRAGANGEVFAVEADPWLCSLLHRSAAELPPGYARVRGLCAAATDTVGMAVFAIKSRSRAGSHLDSIAGESESLVGPTSHRIEVMTVSLDWLLDRWGPPNLIKIDVEGAEQLVLRGATRILRDVRPAIMIETRDSHAAAVTEIFHSHGYRLFDFSAAGAGTEGLPTTTFNTLALPTAAK